jgi:predicted enzyme related to lactoylglutathione lyase
MISYDNFFFPANDLVLGREFYEKVLGLPVKFDFSQAGFLAFQVGEEEPAIILRNLPDSQPAVWMEVDDVQKAYIELLAKGVQFRSEPFRIRTGMAVEFNDPFGNRLGLTDYSKPNQSTEK